MPLDFSDERKELKRYDYIIGVDEAGRGPLAGPVVAGAFCFYKACEDVRAGDPAALSFMQNWPWRIVGDSKTFTEHVRETIYEGYLRAARAIEVRETDVSTLADASTADQSMEAIPNNNHVEAEVAVSSSSEGSTATETASEGFSVEVRVDSPPKTAESLVKIPPPKFDEFTEVYFDFAVSEPTEIDRVNILEASLRSMTRAVYKVINNIAKRQPNKKLRFKVLVDGNRRPHLMEEGMFVTSTPPVLLNGEEGAFVSVKDWQNQIVPALATCVCKPIVKGDAHVLSIAASSIVAKVVRDRIMRQLAKRFPAYGLEVHKGYPTPAHDSIVRSIGPSAIHRLSFAPIYEMLIKDPNLIPPGRDFEEIKIAKTRNKKRPKNATNNKSGRKKGR